MIRLAVLGPETTILSSLCTACPHSPAGCCVAPPRLDLADVGRIVSLGGRDWLLGELAAGRLVRVAGERWLVILRVSPNGAYARCGYHAETGCTIPHERRPATCNFYVCEEALVEGADVRAREVASDLVERFIAWDETLAARAEARGITYDAPFLDWLGETFRAITQRPSSSPASSSE